MINAKRSDENPILVPDAANPWEAEGAYNGCPILRNGKVHMVYRAQSRRQQYCGHDMELSTIGYVSSSDGIHFGTHRQLLKPEFEWERYGCEDPRISYFEGKYHIFYTALSTYPFTAEGIKVGMAISTDLKKVTARYPITPFNSKAMSLFPERIRDKMAVVLTANPDFKPSKIAVALFDKDDDLTSGEYWKNWYERLDDHVIPLQRNPEDHVEVGAPPIKTPHGWLLVYSYIRNYLKPPATFGVEAALLDLKDPRNILGRTRDPILVPEYEYEDYGKVPHIVFPSGAYVRGKKLHVYYGAADTTTCTATLDLKEFIEDIRAVKVRAGKLQRFVENPILKPIGEHAWEAKAVFNPAAFYAGSGVHLVYRAMSNDNTSTMGYAMSKEGFVIDERLPDPIYVPRADFEKKLIPDGNSGCEDPRVTKIGNTLYMFYTAYNGKENPRVALTSISVKDFLARKWNWEMPNLISPPGADDKDAALFPRKINGKFAILHRLGVSIWIDFVDDLEFKDGRVLGGRILMNPRLGKHDSRKIGIAGPPMETKYGWLLLYHGIGREDGRYRLKAALLDKGDPTKVLVRTDEPILEPEMPYEKEGQVSGVVFPCGGVIIGQRLFVYYGGGDSVIGGASVRLAKLIDLLKAGLPKPEVLRR